MKEEYKIHFKKIKKFEKENQKDFFLNTTLEERIEIFEDLLRAPFFLTSLKLLEEASIDYMLIGGIAAGIWGRPRFTQDIDVAIKLEKGGIPHLLKKATDYGFNFEEGIEVKLKSTGVARLKLGHKSLDIISALVKFEKNALKRKRKVKLFNRETYIASPEDLILYKLISGRTIDLADIENIVEANKNQLDKKYLEKWGEILSLQLNIPLIKEKLKKFLKD